VGFEETGNDAMAGDKIEKTGNCHPPSTLVLPLVVETAIRYRARLRDPQAAIGKITHYSRVKFAEPPTTSYLGL